MISTELIKAETPDELKQRNAEILNLYVTDHSLTTFDIAKRYQLSETRIRQIIKDNARYVLEQKDWNKLLRLNLIREDASRPDFKAQVLAKKDLVELWRKEFEGEVNINLVNQLLNIQVINSLDPQQNRLINPPAAQQQHNSDDSKS